MSLQYIIDGYNIVKHPLFRAHKKTRYPSFSLIDLIRTKRLCGSLKNKITVVFDGYPAEPGLRQKDGNAVVIFSGEASADEKIKGLLENSEDRKNTVVVSDDREVAYFAKHAGAKPLGVEDFIKPVAAAHKDMGGEELNYTQISKINQELRKLWLK